MSIALRSIGIAFAFNVAIGCADTASPAAPPRQWDACRLIDVESIADALGAADASELTVSHGLGDIDWSPSRADASSHHRVAVSRCSFGLRRDGAPASSIDLVTRVAGLPDRSESQTLALLRAQGYAPTKVGIDCSQGGLWISGELHAFAKVPSEGYPESCGGREPNAPLHAHAVLIIDLGKSEQDTRQTAMELMTQVLPKLRDEMADLDADHQEVERPSPVDEVPDAGSIISAGDFAQVAAQLQCERMAECCGEVAGSPIADVVDDPATCTALLSAAYGAVLLGAVDAVDRGALRYSPLVTAECFESFEDATCSELVEGLAAPPCLLTAFAGHAEVGSPCISDFECRSGYCEQDLTVRLLSDGGVLLVSPDAGAGDLGVVDDDPSGRDPSHGLDAGAPGSADSSTLDGSVSSSDAGTEDSAALRNLPTGRCREQAEEGASCDSDSACATGRCEDGACAADPTTPWCLGI